MPITAQRSRGIEPIRWQYPYDPSKNPKQVRFHSVIAKEKLFGGAGGGGKSSAMMAEVFRVAAEFGVPTMILRRTYPGLTEIIQRYLTIIPPEIGKWNEQKKTWALKNGGRITLGNLDRDTDVRKYAGSENALIAWDELTQFTEWMYRRMFHPLRLALSHPGYERFKTAGLSPYYISGTNPGDIGHCVPYGEVLTPRGWVDIKSLLIGDTVYSVDQDLKLIPATVDQLHQYLSSEIIEVNSQNFHMACTPEHKVAKMNGQRGTTRKSKFTLVPFEDLPGQATIMRTAEWEGSSIGTIFASRPEWLKPTRTSQPENLSGVHFAKLLGWFLSEGNLIDRDRAIAIAQMKSHTREKLRLFLEEECGFHVSWTKKGAIIYAAGWWQYLKSFDFGKCRDKYVPDFLKNGTQEELAAFLESAMDGDGCRVGRTTGGHYYTTSERLADDVAEIAFKLGYIVEVSSRQRPNRQGLSYMVGFKSTKTGGTELLTGQHRYKVSTVTKRRSDIKRIQHDEPVPTFCIGIAEHHNFVIRQRGSVWISGNSWVRSRFIDPAPPEVVWKPKGTIDEPNPGTRLFIPSKVTDNPFIDGEYIDTLNALPEEERRMIRDGDWDVYAGQVFGDFRRDIHVVEPFNLDFSHVQRVMAVDYGLAAPFCALWGALLPDNTLVVYRELYQDGLLAREQAELIRKSEMPGERRRGSEIPLYLDPACWAREPTSPPVSSPHQAPRDSIAWHYQQAGLPVRKANNDRLAGWAEVHNRLRLQKDGKPRILFFNTCTNTIRTLPTLPRSKTNPEDIDTHSEDHAADTTRYLVMAVPRLPPLQSVRTGKRGSPLGGPGITAGIYDSPT